MSIILKYVLWLINMTVHAIWCQSSYKRAGSCCESASLSHQCSMHWATTVLHYHIHKPSSLSYKIWNGGAAGRVLWSSTYHMEEYIWGLVVGRRQVVGRRWVMGQRWVMGKRQTVHEVSMQAYSVGVCTKALSSCFCTISIHWVPQEIENMICLLQLPPWCDWTSIRNFIPWVKYNCANLLYLSVVSYHLQIRAWSLASYCGHWSQYIDNVNTGDVPAKPAVTRNQTQGAWVELLVLYHWVTNPWQYPAFY